MSDNILKLIPIDPQYVPDITAQQKTRDLLASFVPEADEVCTMVTDDVRFVDPGGNWEGVSCPICGVNLDTGWWQHAVDAAYQTRFADLMVTMSCCGATCSLNDLRYEWPAGFARFVLEVRNPNTDLDDSKVHSLEQILGCALRKIWAHY